jgi:hypothetical protein
MPKSNPAAAAFCLLAYGSTQVASYHPYNLVNGLLHILDLVRAGTFADHLIAFHV